jgi:hypothetical protein
MDAGAEGTPSTTPIGRAGRLEAAALEVAGDHALLVRETGPDPRARALLTTDKLPSGERLVVMPLDDEVEVRVDGDALAVWLGSGVLGEVPRQERVMSPDQVPIWATLVGGALLVVTLVFAVIGSAFVFTWLSRLFA